MLSSFFTSAKSSGNAKIEFWSVGGSTSDRLLRDGLLRTMEPELESAALAGTNYDKKGFFIENVIDWDMIGTCKAVPHPKRLNDGDELFIIGHCKLPDIEKFSPKNPFDTISIAAQGYGFNFSKPTHEALKEKVGEERIAIYPAEVCPRWSAKNWERLMGTYPDELKKLRCSQFVKFFTGRKPFMVKERQQEDGTQLMTSAFYNQFGIIPTDPEFIMRFENEVVENLSQVPELNDEVQRWCSEMKHKLVLSGKESVEDTLKKVCKVYEDTPLEDKYYEIIKHALQMSVEKYSVGIKEYDSFAVSSDIRKKLGLKPFTGEEHYLMMMRILTGRTNKADEAFKTAARKYYSGKRVVVLHDLGLDPMNDDYLAIRLLKYLLC